MQRADGRPRRGQAQLQTGLGPAVDRRRGCAHAGTGEMTGGAAQGISQRRVGVADENPVAGQLQVILDRLGRHLRVDQRHGRGEPTLRHYR